MTMLTAALAHQLDTEGLGVYGRPGTDLFLQRLPDTPVAAVGLYLDAGRRVHGARRPGLQIVVRADEEGVGRARVGHDRALALLHALDGRTHETWAAGTDDELRVAWVLASQAAPVSLGDDDTGRPRWSIRFEVELPVDVG